MAECDAQKCAARLTFLATRENVGERHYMQRTLLSLVSLFMIPATGSSQERAMLQNLISEDFSFLGTKVAALTLDDNAEELLSASHSTDSGRAL